MPLAPFPQLSTPRLLLRELAEADLGELMLVNGDAAVTQFLPYSTWQTIEDGASWLQRMKALAETGTARQLVLVLRETDRVVGTLLLFRFNEGSQRLELGYALGQAYWGKGLMREALVAVCTYALSALGIRRLEAEVNPDNLASNRLLAKLGFVHEGRLRKRWVAKNTAYDTNVYGLLASDWQRSPDAA